MASKGQKDTIGIIFPVLPKHLPRFFNGQKRVFVKFVTRVHRRLQSGSKLFFYESRSNKEVVGEARIGEISWGTVEEVRARFGDDVFLTRAELEEYASNRKAKKMLVLVLGEIRKYEAPLRFKGITMAGRYMTRRMLDSLKANQ